jgi:hypothetical protein
VVGYWTRFAASGDPNDCTAEAPNWPVDDEMNQPAIVLDETIAIADGVRTALCDFWDTVGG